VTQKRMSENEESGQRNGKWRIWWDIVWKCAQSWNYVKYPGLNSVRLLAQNKKERCYSYLQCTFPETW